MSRKHGTLFLSPLIALGAAMIAFSPPSPPPATIDSTPPPGIVRGAENPSAIPYEIAYLHLFRLMAEPSLPREVRADALNGSGLSSDEVDQIIAAAAEFDAAKKGFDAQADAIKNTNWPSPTTEVLRTLEGLEQKRNAVLISVLTSLRGKIGKEAAQRLSFFVEMNFIPKINLVPSRILSKSSHH